MAIEILDFGKELLKYVVRPRYAFVAWITSGMLLTFPSNLMLGNFVHNYDHAIRIICLFSFVLWIVEMLLCLKQPFMEHLEHREILKRMDGLNYYEASILIKAAETACQTQRCPINTPASYSLTDKGFLIRVSEVGKREPDRYYADFTLKDFVWKHLKKPQILTRLKSIPKRD